MGATRRELLGKYLPAAVAAIELGSIPFVIGGDSRRATPTQKAVEPPAPATPTPKEIPVEPTDTTLVADVFQRYGIELVPMTEMDIERHDSADFKYPRWTTERVKMLMSFLSYDNNNGLPPSYYQPDERGNLRIALTVKEDASECCGEFNPGPHRDTRDIKLSLEHFLFDLPNDAYRDIAHEITHNQTYIRTLIEGNTDTGNIFHFTNQQPRTFFYDISEKVGMPHPISEYTGVDDGGFNEYITKIQRKDPDARVKELEAKHKIVYPIYGGDVELKSRLGEDWEEYSFADHYSYGRTNLSEFIAVMGEHYAYGGETYFIKNYGEYLGKEVATELFNYMQKHFFKGWTPPWSEAQKPPFKKAA